MHANLHNVVIECLNFTHCKRKNKIKINTNITDQNYGRLTMLTKVALRLYCYNIINYLLKVFYIHTQDILPQFVSLMSIHEDIVRYIYSTVDIYPSLLNDGLLKKEKEMDEKISK